MSFAYADAPFLSNIFFLLLVVAFASFVLAAGAIAERNLSAGVFMAVIAVAFTLVGCTGASQAVHQREGFVKELEKTYSITLTNESSGKVYPSGEENEEIPVTFVYDDQVYTSSFRIIQTDDTYRVTVAGESEKFLPLDEAVASGEGISTAPSLEKETEQEEKR